MTKRLSDSKVSSMVISDYIIDGATATPVDDYTIWLRCAGLPNTYGSLANVIADTGARTALCNNLNALRYMVRSVSVITPAVLASADWVTTLSSSIYAVSIPTMTGFTTPSGTVSAESTYATYVAWWAFDKSTSTYWISAQVPGTHWLRYMFSTAIWAFKFDIRNSYLSYNYGFKNAKLQGSNNGSTWVDLTANILFPTDTTLTEYLVSVANFTSYKYYQIVGSDSWDSAGLVSVTELNIYGLNLA